MNVLFEQALLVQMAICVIMAIALAVTATYFLRPKVRARFPGGNGRYLTALVIQASAFMIPIPIVLILAWGRMWPGLDVLLSVAAGVVVVSLLRFLPVAGLLLRDLARTRLEIALERMGERP